MSKLVVLKKNNSFEYIFGRGKNIKKSTRKILKDYRKSESKHIR